MALLLVSSSNDDIFVVDEYLTAFFKAQTFTQQLTDGSALLPDVLVEQKRFSFGNENDTI